MEKTSTKLNQLTFTRFIAAVAIVVFHFGKYFPPFNINILLRIFNNANLLVSYFFILSGFIMVVAYAHLREIKLREYYINRLSRIYPIYFLGLILVVLFFTDRFEITGFLLNAFLLQGWVPKYASSYNLPGWSLSSEAFFYLLFPMLYNYIYTKYSFKNVFIAISLFWVIMQCSFYLMGKYGDAFVTIPFAGDDRMHFVYYLPFFHLNEFLAGNAAGLLFMGLKTSKINPPGVLAKATIIILVIITAFFIYRIPSLKDYALANLHNGFLAVVFIPLILWLASAKASLAKPLASKPLILLGNISYEIYILQFPVFMAMGSINKNLKLGDIASFYSSFVVLIVVSALCHLFIEKPLLKVIRKYSH